jgi:hypothetical protein
VFYVIVFSFAYLTLLSGALLLTSPYVLDAPNLKNLDDFSTREWTRFISAKTINNTRLGWFRIVYGLALYALVRFVYATWIASLTVGVRVLSALL